MSRRITALTASALFLTLAPLLGADPPPADKAFDAITPEQIAAALKAAKKPAEKIDGSDTEANQLPAGAVLVYRTNEGRHGKLKVVEHGRDLTVRWVTYEKDGTVASKGDKLTVRGTFTAELDAGKQAERTDRAKADFWWEQKDKTTRFLVPMNKAEFVVYGPKK
jgi:hypothetical protein